MWSQRGSPAGTQSTFRSRPASSAISSTATGRALMWHPGNVGSSSSTRASRGSPSSARVSGKNPYSAGYTVAAKRCLSSQTSPVSWSISYLLHDPWGISTTTSNASLPTPAGYSRVSRSTLPRR